MSFVSETKQGEIVAKGVHAVLITTAGQLENVYYNPDEIDQIVNGLRLRELLARVLPRTERTPLYELKRDQFQKFVYHGAFLVIHFKPTENQTHKLPLNEAATFAFVDAPSSINDDGTVTYTDVSLNDLIYGPVVCFGINTEPDSQWEPVNLNVDDLFKFMIEKSARLRQE